MEENEWYTKKWTTGELNALVKILGEETARKILKGEVGIRLEETIRMLFDKNGRRIPQGLNARVIDPDNDFYLSQPEMTTLDDYASRILRLHNNLGINTGITAERFKREIERQLVLIQGNPRVANILNGVWLPMILPKLETDDLGMVLGQYLEAAERSYVRTFPNRKFNNYRKGELSGKVSVVEDAGANLLIERMKQGPVIAIHFPNSMQGYSILAAREQMETLPENFALSGLDTIIAMIMYPDILARDWHTPGLDLAALSWRSADYSLYFEADDAGLDFGPRASLAYAHDNYSAGLVFFG